MQNNRVCIKKELDPVYETWGLIYLAFQVPDKEEIIKELHELGVEAEKFYQKYIKLVERYTRSFKKYMNPVPEMEFFCREGDEDVFFKIAAVLLVEHREWFESMSGVTDDELRGKIAFILNDENNKVLSLKNDDMPSFSGEKEVISYLMGLDCKDGIKWHLLELMEKPKYWVEILIKAVKSNIPAFEKALKDIEKPLEPLMKRFEKFEDEHFAKMTETFAPDSIIYPTLVSGSGQIIFYTHAYEGIFIEYLFKKGRGRDERKESLVLRAKALGDKSKLDILCALKQSSKYNLELAEALNLSASTMSHHMNALFTCGFVSVEKKDGRVYYCLQKETVREFIADLEQVL